MRASAFAFAIAIATFACPATYDYHKNCLRPEFQRNAHEYTANAEMIIQSPISTMLTGIAVAYAGQQGY